MHFYSIFFFFNLWAILTRQAQTLDFFGETICFRLFVCLFPCNEHHNVARRPAPTERSHPSREQKLLRAGGLRALYIPEPLTYSMCWHALMCLQYPKHDLITCRRREIIKPALTSLATYSELVSKISKRDTKRDKKTCGDLWEREKEVSCSSQTKQHRRNCCIMA